MESLSLSESLLEYMRASASIDASTAMQVTNGAIEVVGRFLYNFSVPSSWRLADMEQPGNGIFVLRWVTDAAQAVCAECGVASSHRSTLYFPRSIQDLPISGMTVYHNIRARRFYCDNPECRVRTFFEQFEDLATKDARLSNRLKNFVVRQAVESSCIGTSRALRGVGILVSADTVNREVKKMGAMVVAANLERDDIEVLSVDDVNLRKGNSSTACSVFIDGMTHRVLVIVEGADSETAEKVIRQYPSSTTVSRDRACAYSAAAAKFGKIQVADGFHLVQNIHKAVKDALSQAMPNDVFIREGAGWLRIVDSPCEDPEFMSPSEDSADSIVALQPATVPEGDRERRIHLAGLKGHQADKYRKTMDILELTENGIRSQEIATRLGMERADVVTYRKNAPETVENVELKIDEYYRMHEDGQWERHQRTIAPKAKLSSASIVEPYRETVLRMFNEGKNHRGIHPVIVSEGFPGSANAVYQYLIKYAHENDISYGRASRVIPVAERQEAAEPRPPRISIERVARSTIYESVLRICAAKREEIRTSLQGPEVPPTEHPQGEERSTLADRVIKTSLPASVSAIIHRTKPKSKGLKKKLDDATFDRIGQAVTRVPHLIAFLIAFHELLLLSDTEKLDAFLGQYQGDSIKAVSSFANGLKRDYDAVKNCLLYPQISNGPMEGTNNKIKMIRRRGYGRAGLELTNALAVLPWHFRDIDGTTNASNSAVA